MTLYDRYLAIAKEKLKEKNFEEAQKHLLLASEINPNSHEALFLLGNLYHTQSNFEKAIESYKKALALKPNYTDAALSLSILYNDLGQYEEWRLMFNRAQKQVSGPTDFQDSYIQEKLALKHVELGELYETYHRFLEAEEQYEKALKLSPQSPEFIIRIAKVHEKQGALSESLKELKKLKIFYPDYVPGLVKLGLAYYAQGKMIEAIQEWERVLDMDPKNSEALLYLDMAQKAQTTSL